MSEMKIYIIFIIVAFIICFLWELKKRGRIKNTYRENHYGNTPLYIKTEPKNEYGKLPTNDLEEWRYIRTETREYAFDSTIERDTYNMLRKEVGRWVKIDFHVHLNEIFKIVDREDGYFNKLWVCHVDFILRDRKNPMKIYCAIEIDGHNSHRQNVSTQNNDLFKNRIFRENNIPLIRLCGDECPNFKPFEEETYSHNLKNIFDHIKDVYSVQ